MFLRNKQFVSLALAIALAGAVAASAQAVTTAQDVTLRVSGSSNRTVTMTSGSTYDTLTVQGGGFQFTLSGTQSVTLQSSSKDIMTNTFGITATCNDTTSQVTLSASKGSTVGVTLEGVACSSSGSGGGGGSSSSSGGGGGGGSSSSSSSTQTTTTSAAPATTPATSAESTTPVVGTPAPSTVPAPAVTSSVPALTITRPLTIGSEGDDVRALQQALATMPDIYPEGLVTGYFGSLSKAAVGKFQMKYALVSSTNDSAYGFVGPQTRAKLAEVFGGSSAVVAPITTAPVSVPTGISALTRELDQGDEGDDVHSLQAYLAQDSALYPQGLITGYYGPLTTAAVRRFQEKYGISPVGRVGPQTLAKLNELMGAGSSTAVPPSAPSATPVPSGSTSEEAALQKQIQDLQALINSLNSQIQAIQ